MDGAWRDVDTTPAVWADTEREEASILEPLRDLWSWGGFLFARWRWSEEESGVGDYAAWLLIPLVLLLVWRLYSRRRVGRRRPRPRERAPAPSPGPGLRVLPDRAAPRTPRAAAAARPSQRRRWIERIHATELRPIMALHYRYRFDPAGLERHRPRRR